MSQTFEHLTAEPILAAARRLGIELDHSGYWYDPDAGYGCAAGVAALAAHPELQTADGLCPALMHRAGMPWPVIASLSDGFEGEPSEPGRFPAEDRAGYLAHFAIGRAVAAAVAGGEEAQHGRPV